MSESAPSIVAGPGVIRVSRPVISIISPTYNEQSNLRPLVAAIGKTMEGRDWELIIVDDDSPDGTFAEAQALASEGWPVRCLRRIGRRGLASAVVEGMLTASADILAVIDADMQHDERLLSRMLDLLSTTDAELVVATRYGGDGGFGEWTGRRQAMSRFATWCSKMLIGTQISDPMSGFFALRRSVFEACVYDLSQQGYKILLDILTSSPRTLRIAELPYVFRNRLSGTSKLDLAIASEYFLLLVDKLTRGLVPPKFLLFCLVGGLGLIVHLAVLQTMGALGLAFVPSQAIATLAAMAMNFLVNNSVTYRREALKGWGLVKGWMLFCLACSFGALANMGIADLVIEDVGNWPLAGIAGAVMGAVFNFGVASRLVWRDRRHSGARQPTEEHRAPAAAAQHGADAGRPFTQPDYAGRHPAREIPSGIAG